MKYIPKFQNPNKSFAPAAESTNTNRQREEAINKFKNANKVKSSFIPYDQSSISSDTKTDKERQISSEWAEDVSSPSINTLLSEGIQYPLRVFADPTKLLKRGYKDEIIKSRKTQLNPYLTNKQKNKATFNEARDLGINASINAGIMELGFIGNGAMPRTLMGAFQQGAKANFIADLLQLSKTDFDKIDEGNLEEIGTFLINGVSTLTHLNNFDAQRVVSRIKNWNNITKSDKIDVIKDITNLSFAGGQQFQRESIDKKYKNGGRLVPKFQSPYQPMPGRKYIPETKQYLNTARDKETQAQINKEQIDANNSQNNSNEITDFGTRLLNGLKTFGGSYVGDAIASVSPSAANTVSNLTLGLVSQTPKKLLESNRSNDSNKWENRVNLINEAATNVAAGEFIGAGMQKAAPYIANTLSLVSKKINNLPQLSKNIYKINPNWLMGYKKIPIRTNISANEMSSKISSKNIQFKNEDLVEVILKGRNSAVEFLDSPIVQKSYIHNQNLARKLGITLPNKPDILEVVKAPINVGAKDIGENIGAHIVDGGYKDPTSEIIINNSIKQSKYDATSGSFHEFLHRGYYGKPLRPYSGMSKEYYNNTFKPETRFYQWKNNKLFKSNYKDTYLDNVLDGEPAANIVQLGKELNIKVGQEYPGKQVLKQMLDDYSGNKEFIKQYLNLDKPKRIWDALSGNFYMAPTSLIIGSTLLPTQNEDR